MEGGNAKSDNNTAENSHLQGSYTKNLSGGVFRHCFNSALCGDKSAYGGVHNEVCYSSGKCGDFLFSFCHADSNTHCKKQCKVIENGTSCLIHYFKNGIEQSALVDNAIKPVCFKGSGVGKGASYAQQKSCNWKNGNRQHK